MTKLSMLKIKVEIVNACMWNVNMLLWLCGINITFTNIRKKSEVYWFIKSKLKELQKIRRDILSSSKILLFVPNHSVVST
jgi:hypothetical protein